MAKAYKVMEELIEKGGATKKSLMEACEITSDKSFESQLRMMRIRDNFPVPDDDGIYSFVEEEEWEKINAKEKAKRKAAAPKRKTFLKTPQAKLVASHATYDRTLGAVDRATEAFKKDNDVLKDLALQSTQINFRIAKIRLQRLKEKIAQQLNVSIDTVMTYYTDETLDSVMDAARKAYEEELEKAKAEKEKTDSEGDNTNVVEEQVGETINSILEG